MVFNFLLSFLYEFGQRRQLSCFKSVPVLGNVVVVHFLEFRRGVVADGIAGLFARAIVFLYIQSNLGILYNFN